MDARLFWVVSRTTSLLGLLVALSAGSSAVAAGYKTANFTVSAPTPQLAKEIGDRAEACRRELAILWLGQELPPWGKPCPIHAKVAPKMGAGGATSFVFDRGEVFGWKMNIQGSRERILDSVVPHEVTHTVFASYFRRPLPRWADEGACTTVEHRSEVAKQERMLVEFLKTGRGLAFSEMFAMKEYPADVMPLYSQGHSLAQWLIENRGRKAFLEFLADGMQDENWPRAVEQHYGFDGLYAMQNAWLAWVKQGRPELTPETSPIAQLVASRGSEPPGNALAGQPTLRMQSPDDITRVAATSIEPANGGSRGSQVTVASGSGSVYAAAAQAERQRKEETGAAPATSAANSKAPGPSIYDASLGTGVLRR
jgi:hypothetical protein